jgi:tRNA 2-thiouridine synthesizing protein A
MKRQLDLRGVRCPLSWAKAKVLLETLAAGEEVDLILDDPKGIRDIPRAAEAEGYAVADPELAGTAWRLTITV